jgi:hypothetical protein
MDKLKEFLSTKAGKITGIITVGVVAIAISGVLIFTVFDDDDNRHHVTTDPYNTDDPGDGRLWEPPPDPRVPPTPIKVEDLVRGVFQWICPLTGELINEEDIRHHPLLTEPPDPNGDDVPTDTNGSPVVTTGGGTSPTGGTTPTGGTNPTGGNGTTSTGTQSNPSFSNVITLNGSNSTADASEDNVRISTGTNSGITTVQIRRAGTYVITGTLANGRINVGSNDDFPGGDVTLILRNVNITNGDSPPIRATSRVSSLTILNESGTTNTLRDTREPRLDTDDQDDGVDGGEEDDDPRRNAALFSRAPLFISGAGTLNVHGGYAHGIHARGDGSTLTITSTNVNVQSASVHGLRSRRSTIIINSRVNITAERKGIRAAGSSFGNITIRDNSTVNITTVGDAIHAEININILENSTVNATTDGGWQNGNRQHLTIGSRRGLRAGGPVNVANSKLTLNCAGAGIHSSSNVIFDNVTAEISAFTQGIRGQFGVWLSDTNLTIPISTIALHGGSNPASHDRPASHIYFNDGCVLNLHFVSTVINANVPNRPNESVFNNGTNSATRCNGCH